MKKAATKEPDENQAKISVKEKLKDQLKNTKVKVLLVVISIILLGVYINAADHSALSANFADSVLRPLLGNERTLALESFLFNSSDLFNQLRYKLIKPQSPFTVESAKVISQPLPEKDPVMDLSPISPQIPNPLPQEGIWQPIPLTLFPNQTVMAKTFVRPDPERPYAIVSLVKMDMEKLSISAVAGTKEPGGGEGHPGPGKIPWAIQNSNKLVGAFNGGFQEKDGHYGMIVGDLTYLPLKKGLATLVIDKDTHPHILLYQGQTFDKNNLVIRQNGEMLLEDSVIIPSDQDNQYDVWGRTVTSTMYTWRSGIGVTKNGNLIYAAGPSLIPQTLAQALLRAGAVNAMQLDINPYWVRFVIFTPLGEGKYQHYSLQKNMYDGGSQYLYGYQKDFFYLYKR